MEYKRKFKIIILFLIIVIAFVLVKSIKAQENQDSNKINAGYVAKCLNIECGGLSKCNGYSEKDLPSSKKDHVARISGEGFPKNTDIYVIGCITTERGYVCSAGSDTKSNKLPNPEQVNKEVRELGFDVISTPEFAGGIYEFELLHNPVNSGEDGKIRLFVRSATRARSTQHRFLGIYAVEGKYNEGGDIGEDNTVTYRAADFKKVFESDPKECVSIRFDPQGRVFDAKSLEPLPDVTVKILDREGKLLSPKPGFNPVKITEPDGIFSFYVESGIYKINVVKKGYRYPVNKQEINPNYKEIYRCDTEKVGPGAEIYNQQYEINESEGKIVRCDIPMMPLNEPYRGKVVVFDYGQIILPSGHVNYSARFSHPLAIGILQREDNGKEVARAQADRDGVWNVNLEKAEVPQDTALVLKVEKVNLAVNKTSKAKKVKEMFNKVITYIGKVIPFVKAEDEYYKTSIRFEPILQYIEGYIYDNEGKAMKNAKVRIISHSTGNVLLEATTDEKGIVKIPPEYLPILPYDIQVEKGNKTYIFTTSKFAKENGVYLMERGISLVEGKVSGEEIALADEKRGEIVSKYRIKRPEVAESVRLNEDKEAGNSKLLMDKRITNQNNSVDTGENKESKRFVWGVIGLLVIFFITTVVGIIYYLRSKV